MSEGIPLPIPTELSQPFWDGCKQGELRVQRCRACATHVFVPQPVCGSCFADKSLEWVTSTGRGTVYSFSRVYRPATPAFEIPYAVAIVELEEGWYMLSNVVDCAVEEVEVGMPVEVTFRAVSDSISLPLFKPVS